MTYRTHSGGVRAMRTWPILVAVGIAALLGGGCGDSGNGTTREVGSAALLGFDSENLTAIAVPIDVATGAAPLHVYLGVPATDPLMLPPGRYLIAVVTPYGDMESKEVTVTVTVAGGEAIPLAAPAGEDSAADRDAQRNAAATLVDFALIFRLGLLQAEQALTNDFQASVDDPALKVSDDGYDLYLDIMNGLSEYEEQVSAAISRLFRDSPFAGQVLGGRAGGRLSGPGVSGPSAGWKDSVKDFFTNNGKGGNDARARDTLLRNTQDLSPEQQQQVFDDIKNAAQDNTNVKNAGGVTETTADEFFKSLEKGKYNKVAQDLEKGARTNPDYNTQLQQNKDTPADRGPREGGKALRDGGKVIEDIIKEVVPGPGKKVIKAGEKIEELTTKKPTPRPGQPTPRSRANTTPGQTPQQTVPTAAETVAPATVSVPTVPRATVAAPTVIPPTVNPATVAPPTAVPPTVAPPTVAPPTVTPPTVGPATVPPPTVGVATAPAGTVAPAATIPPATVPPATVPASTVGPAGTTPPKVYLNEITGLKVVLVKLGKGDVEGTTSYEIDVVVSTIVRTPPAAMVNCTTPFGSGHNIGSSSLHPGERFTIPLHREDLYPTTTVTVTCTIVQGNTMSGSTAVPGKCRALANTTLLGAFAPDPCAAVTDTPEPSAAAEISATPSAVTPTPDAATAAPASSTAAPATAAPATVAPPTAPSATDTAVPPTAVPPTPVPTVPPPTSTPEPVATPTFEPQVIQSFFWPATVFAVQTVSLEQGHLFRICLSGTMHLEEGDFGPAEMATVNGIVPTPCVVLEGDGGPAGIQCGHGTPREDIDPGGFSIVVTDLGPA